MGIGEVYCKRNDNEDALKYYKEALASRQRYPDRADILIRLGKKNVKIEDVEKAIDYFDDGLSNCKGINQQSDQLFKP